MKIKLKLLIINFTICIGMIFALPLQSQATLQSNGDTEVSKTWGEWIIDIRQMEALGGTLGLSDTINTTSLVSNGESNNLDVHMQKNTEYGAMAILSASSYGNPSKINDGDTTTGNKSGIVMKINQELVSATYNKGDIKEKYVNIYLTKYSLRGDAIDETEGWYGSTQNGWLFTPFYGGTTILLRATNNSIFSYGATGDFHFDSSNSSHATRAVIVSGPNF